MRVNLHDVPDDRAPADLDQRLWTELRFLGDTGAQSAGEYDGPGHGALRENGFIVADLCTSNAPTQGWQ
jgi:hypothetical protein